MSPSKVQAQAEGNAFSCDGTFYQIRQVGTTSSLFRVNRSATNYTSVAVNVNGGSNNLGVLLNGLAYNSQDGYMYALSTTGNTTTLPTSIQLYKIGQGGIQLLGTVTGMPNIQVASGTIDKNGNYYVSSQNSTGTANYNIYQFNLNAATTANKLTATALRLYNAANTGTVSLTFYDLAVNPQDNQLYAVYQNGTLWRVDPAAVAGRALVSVIKATATNTDPVGTSFFDVAGNMFVYTNGTVGTANSGNFYQVDLSTGVYTAISTVDPASVSDGASCINPGQSIDVVKQVNSIARTTTTAGIDGREFDIAFTLRVKNTGTATANNVQVNDFLWSGTSGTTRANTTFSSVAATAPTSVTLQVPTAVIADPTNTNSVFALARNTGYTGVGGPAPATSAALLTGTQPLTAGQAAIVTFTVRVTYAATSNVPARLTNEAYASSTTAANATGYRQNATSGFLSSPDQLVAADRSTDSPSLPVTASGDTPTPSPIFFSTSISGTVFEDINYGGGAGRSQLNSKGFGVEGTRVELYSSTGNFLTFTTTDAAGNYAFSSIDGGTNALAAGTSYQVRVVNRTVVSNRQGSPAGLLAVQTFRNNSLTGNGTTNEIGGANPNLVDYPANSGTVTGTGGQTLTALATANGNTGVVQTITTVTTPSATAGTAAALGVDFGFNFSTVVNTNDTGQGSLRQFILNSNALTNENLAQTSSVTGVSLLPGKEYAIFMLNDGTTTTNGLRSGTTVRATGFNATTGFTITPTTALSTISDDDTVIDGALQAAVTGNKVAAVVETTTGPEVTINFNALKGLFVTGGSTTIANLGLNNAKGSIGSGTVTNSDGAGVTLSSASASGSTVMGITTSGNARAGVRVEGGVADVTISGNVLNNNSSTVTTVDADGLELLGATDALVNNNTINGNKGYGIFMTVAANTGNTISNNIIRNNGSGTTTADAGISIGNLSTDNTFSGNTITGNYGDGIVALSGALNNRFTQNSISGNADLGIDLSATAAVIGDGMTKNANGKTADNGANGLLNFPVITQAVITNVTTGNLQITGYAPAGSTIEFFVSDKIVAGFGQGKTYLFSTLEGGSMPSTTNSTLAAIADLDAKFGGYSGTVNGFDQGSETGASRFYYNIPLANLTPNQRTAVLNSATRLTATATVNGNTTSEFSSNILIKQAAPLPVQLASFTAKAVGQSAQLNWRTAQELNNDHFIIERSYDAKRFDAVGQVQGQGTTALATDYRFTDARAGQQALGQVAYYRLRQVDTDGSLAYSAVQAVSFSTTAGISVTPNPAADQARLELGSLPAGTYQVAVLDVAGRLVHQAAAQGGQGQALPVGQWPAGVYLVRVQGQNLVQTTRLVKP